MTCLTRRRCRAAMFALRAIATSDPFFRLAVVLWTEDSQPLITLSYTTAAASAVGVALVKKLGCFLLLCAAMLAVLLPSCRGACPVLEARGGSSRALRGCVPSASALGSGRGGAAHGLEVRGPVLQPQVGGLCAGFAVEGRMQWRRGCDELKSSGPRVLRWRVPLAADDGRERRAVRFFAPSLDVARRCLSRLIGLLASFT